MSPVAQRLRAHLPPTPLRQLLHVEAWAALGGWIDFLAILGLAVWQFQAGAQGLVMISVCMLLPGIVASRWVGRWCDAGHARALLRTSLWLRGAMTLGLLVCTQFDVFLVLLALRSLLFSVYQPAIQVMGVRTVPVALRDRFQAQLTLVMSTAKVLAPLLGAACAALWGERWALLLAALASGMALLALRSVPQQEAEPAPAQSQPHPTAPAIATAQQSGSAKPVLASGSLLALLWMVGTEWMAAAVYNNLSPAVLHKAGLGSHWLGIVAGVSGLGNVLASAWMVRRRKVAQGWMSLALPAAWVGVCTLGYGAMFTWDSPHMRWGLLFWAVLSSMGMATYLIAQNRFMVQHHAPQLGRASAAVQATQNSCLLLGPFAGAWVFSQHGTLALYMASSLVIAVGLVLLPLVLRLCQRQERVDGLPA
ncbi:MFS transporter [Roseateles sp. BYS180W]|uniref:MFS transporter n=1 Tax=Roseateles rivi TaxID=3299028 RepID=A0ABW7FZQ7_9BURK